MKDNQVDTSRILKKAKEVIRQAEQGRYTTTSQMFLDDCNALLAGKLEVLEKRDFADKLSDRIVSTCLQDDVEHFEKYILQLKKGIRFSRLAREHVLSISSNIMQQLPDSASDFYLSHLLSFCIQYLRVEQHVSDGLGASFNQMKKICLLLLNGESWSKSISFLEIVAQIQLGIIEKSPNFVLLAKKLQDTIATKEILTKITDKYLFGEEVEQQHAAKTLLFLGRRAVIFLMNMLIRVEEINQQNLLTGLLSKYDREAYSIFNDCLSKTKSVSVIQRVIKLYEQTGDDYTYMFVRPYLSHQDIVVQQYVVHCIAAFDRKRAKARLLEAIKHVDDRLKPQLIMQLGTFDGEDVETCLVDIVENRRSIKAQVYDQIINVACLALKAFPGEKSVTALKELAEEPRLNEEENRHLLYTVENTLNLLVPIWRHSIKGAEQYNENVSFELSEEQKNRKNKQAKAIEEEALLLIENGQTEEATSFVVSQIHSFAKNRDFVTAQYLQNKLLSLNPMALEEVIEAEEFIEREKLLPESANNFSFTEEFQKYLSPIECNAILDSMISELYGEDEIIVNSGEIDPCLYFINSGQVNVECMSNGKAVFLKKLKAGDVMGVNTFFSCAVWTYTMVAHKSCQLYVLSRKKYNELIDIHPGLADKFYHYCSKYDILANLIKIAGNDRREYPRFRVNRLLNCRMLDAYGHAGKKRFMKGELDDISRVGISYVIPVSEKINPMLLLGKMVECSIPTSKGTNQYTRIGTIVAAKDLKTDNKYSIHVKFQEALKQNEIMEITQ